MGGNPNFKNSLILMMELRSRYFDHVEESRINLEVLLPSFEPLNP
jgi:hypothetical protein